MYASVTPRLPSRPQSCGTSARRTPRGEQASTVTRTLEPALTDATDDLLLFALRRSISPLKRTVEHETARNVLGALSREYGSLSRCPKGMLDAAILVCGMHSESDVEAIRLELEAEHRQERQREAEQAEALKRLPLNSTERKRALLNSRLRYQACTLTQLEDGSTLPRPPSSARLAAEQVINPRSLIAGRSVAITEKSSPTGGGDSAVAAIARTSSRSPKVTHVGSQASSSRSSSSARGSSTAHAKSQSSFKRLPNATVSSSRPASGSPRDSKMAQLELLNFRRILNEAHQKIPILQRIKVQKKIDMSSLEGQVDMLTEIFSIMNAKGGGEVDLEEFMTFGKRIGGESVGRVFSKKMFTWIRRCGGGSTMQPINSIMLTRNGSSAVPSGYAGETPLKRTATLSRLNASAGAASTLSSSRTDQGITKEAFLRAMLPQYQAQLDALRLQHQQQDAARAAAATAEASKRKWQDEWLPEDLTLLGFMFNGADTDGNGLVSGADLLSFTASHKKEKMAEHEAQASLAMFEAQIALYDTDDDGAVTLEQFAAMQKPVFDLQKKHEVAEQVFFFRDVKAVW